MFGLVVVFGGGVDRLPPMDSNTHSTQSAEPSASPEPSAAPGPLELAGPPVLPDDLAGLAAVVDELEAEDLDRLSDSVRAERALGLRWLADRLEGQWLKELAGVDALGAAGADQGMAAPSTASWLRNRLRMAPGQARDAVRTARALFRGPLTGTARALTDGVLSPAHARVLAQGTRQLPDHVTREAEPVLLETAVRVDPPRLGQAVGYLLQVADPDRADAQAQRRHARRGLWLAATLDSMVAVNGLLEPEAGHIVLAALEPLARPSDADDRRNGDQRNADALVELARRALEGGRLPKAGGVRPQLLVTTDLDSLAGRPGGLGGELGWAEPLEAEACRRLACDATVTRVLITRDHDPSGARGVAVDPGGDQSTCDPSAPVGLQERLRAAMALLPPTLGGAPSRPLEVGRATRVVAPAQRAALAVRDGGCVFPDCDRPLAWCDAHHLWHWVDGGPTELGNLALVCREHHRQVHEGGWQLARGPDGRFTATPTSEDTAPPKGGPGAAPATVPAT
jgi:Domain of unknown function (DUF222)